MLPLVGFSGWQRGVHLRLLPLLRVLDAVETHQQILTDTALAEMGSVTP